MSDHGSDDVAVHSDTVVDILAHMQATQANQITTAIDKLVDEGQRQQDRYQSLVKRNDDQTLQIAFLQRRNDEQAASISDLTEQNAALQRRNDEQVAMISDLTEQNAALQRRNDEQVAMISDLAHRNEEQARRIDFLILLGESKMQSNGLCWMPAWYIGKCH